MAYARCHGNSGSRNKPRSTRPVSRVAQQPTGCRTSHSPTDRRRGVYSRSLNEPSNIVARSARLGSTLALAGCLFHRLPAAPADPCWNASPPTSYLEETAVFALLEMKDRQGDRVRSLAGVPLLADSIHARVEV